MTSSPRSRRYPLGFWSLWGIFAVLAIIEGVWNHVWSADSPPATAFDVPLRYPWWLVPFALGFITVQTAFIQVILGDKPEEQPLWRTIIAVLYTGPVMVLYTLTPLMGHPSPGAIGIPVTPAVHAIVLFLVSVLASLFALVRAALSVMTWRKRV